MSEKKLSKSKSDKIISGVCGGLAKHLGISATLIRILWAVFGCTGLGLVIYIVLAVILPEGE